MSRPLYPSWSDTALRVALAGGAATALAVLVGPWVYVRTPYNQGRQAPVEQPVQFDHRHHVQDDGIECLYCHTLAERSSAAGIPATDVCMGCHSQVWDDSPKLAPVRYSFDSGEPIPWKRVHDLPGFVYFNHSVHVHAGVSCQHCHGPVETMAQVYKARSLTMGFCLDCHRDPGAQIPGYRPAAAFTPAALAAAPIVQNRLMTCTACHR